MPLSTIGIIHTLLGIIALASVAKLLWQDHQISYQSKTAKIYLAATTLTAASALTIFKHGGFNTAHALAILTLLATATGVMLEASKILGSLNKYLSNICYMATLLFHLLPTATEVMTRFPMDNPMVSSLTDPLLQKTFLVILIIWALGLGLQLYWLRSQDDTMSTPQESP